MRPILMSFMLAAALILSACTGSGSNLVPDVLPPPPTTLAQACDDYDLNPAVIIIQRRIETGQIPESRAAKYAELDAAVTAICDTGGSVEDVQAAKKAALLEAMLLLSDKLG